MKKIIGAILFASAILLSLLTPVLASSLSLQTTTIINVGQGDSILVRDGNGFDVLIDGGKPDAGPVVLAYLRNLGITDIDVMVASHSDSDHIGGLISVLQADDIIIHEVLYNGYPGDTVTWNNFVSAVASDGLVLNTINFPSDLTWGSMQAHVLNPESGLINPESNDASIVIRLDYGTVNYLFTGDISSTIESTIIARETPIASEILKVAHHGSSYSTSDYFLTYADPSISAISVGPNSYGHPSDLTIDRLINSGSQVFRTDQSGNITITSDGTTYTVITEITPIYSVFLPIIIKFTPTPETPTPTPETPTPTPETPTPTPETPTPTPETPTPTPETPTSEPTPITGNIIITYIFYDGVVSSYEPDEYVVIQNKDAKAIQIQNWSLRDAANHIYTFPYFIMQPGQICRIYTNENHPESCGFNYGSGSAIWNNGGDCADLRDSSGVSKSTYCYP